MIDRLIEPMEWCIEKSFVGFDKRPFVCKM